jgi:pimeloyl-ACP methyl ester carboxylesterase
MPIARVNGVRLYYEEAGHTVTPAAHGLPETGDPSVVLVHGFACGLRSWDFQVKALARTRRVIAYDVRGHGLSEAPGEATAYGQATSVADLHALLVELRIRRAVVAGLSMGGNIALNFAMAHPEMVSGLVVADTGAGSDETEMWRTTVYALAEAAERDGMEAFADLACANPLFARYVAQGPAQERFIRSCLMTHRARGIANTAREVLARRPTLYSLESALATLGMPTLLIVGEHDEPCLRVHAFMARAIPRAWSVVLRGLGHLTPLEAPAVFNRALNRFLASL